MKGTGTVDENIENKNTNKQLRKQTNKSYKNYDKQTTKYIHIGL